jgi:predicted TIM-barrel fold metal-dependent hydrolase
MEQQIAVMDKYGIDKAVILPLNNPETPAEPQSWGEILYICEKYPGRFIPFCNIDPRLPRRPDLLKADHFLEILNQCKALGFKGIGEVTARIPWDDPALGMLFSACEQVGFPVIFHTISADANLYGLIDELGLPRFESVLKRFPRLQFLGHSPGFWTEINGSLTLEEKNAYPKEPVKPGGRLPELFRKYPNLNGDLSAGSGLNALARDPDHAACFIEEFQDRLFFGLDICSAAGKVGHFDWFNEQLAVGRISRQAYEKIMWKNANRLLALDIPG